MVDRQNTSLNSPKLYIALWLLVGMIFYLAVLPSLYLFVWAIAGTETVGVLDVQHPTLHWFWQLLSDREWQSSLIYSTVTAIATSFMGCVILLAHFYFMRFASRLLDHLAFASALLIVLIPLVNYALALRAIGGQLGLPEALILALGHLVTIVPLQFFILESRQETVPTSLLYAGNTLGASHISNILRVYLPLMKESLVYAFAIGFFASFDELVIATFVLDSPLITVPRRLWSQVDHKMDPSPAVISSLLLLTVVAAVLGARLLTLGRKAVRALRT